MSTETTTVITESEPKVTKKLAKKVTKKAAKKAAKKDDSLTAKEKQAKAAERPIKWNPRRIAVVRALRKLGAYDAAAARPAGDIITAGGGAKVFALEGIKGADELMADALYRVRICLDVYRGTELTYHGFAKGIRNEGSRELLYYLTAKGIKVDLKAAVEG